MLKKVCRVVVLLFLPGAWEGLELFSVKWAEVVFSAILTVVVGYLENQQLICLLTTYFFSYSILFNVLTFFGVSTSYVSFFLLETKLFSVLLQIKIMYAW